MLSFKQNRKNNLKNQKGMAIIELVPIMIIIILLFNFSLGFFGAIHTGILNSMAARNYAFETFRHRSNLTYLREGGADIVTYTEEGFRLHATTSDNAKGNKEQFIATGRPIDFLADANLATGSKDLHNSQIYGIIDGKRYTAGGGVSPIWIRPQYGICLNSKCERIK